MTQYQLAQPDRYYIFTNQGWIEVKGKSIRVRGQVIDLFMYLDDLQGWTLTEGTSGHCFGSSAITQRECRERAREILARVGNTFLQERIAKAVKAHGLSPQYREVAE